MVLTHGADVNTRTSQGLTPLHLATTHNLAGNVRELLLLGADVTAEDNSGAIPLEYICRESSEAKEVARYILAFMFRETGHTVDMRRLGGAYRRSKEWVTLNEEHRTMSKLSMLLCRSIDCCRHFNPDACCMYLERLMQIDSPLPRADVLNCYVPPFAVDTVRVLLRECWSLTKEAMDNGEAAHVAVMLDKCMLIDHLRRTLLHIPLARARFDVCAACRRPARVKHCSKCMQTPYCSVRCQASVWRTHKLVCAPPMEELD